MITLDTPLKFTAPGGVAYAGRGKWHLPQGDQPGEWMRDYRDAPILCRRGYHWCEARYAIRYLHAECYLIETRGITVKGADKHVSQGARLLRRIETWNARTARLFAADCAEKVVHLCGDDLRPRAAIEAARRFARGKATESELTAARDAAWDAARDAAWDAAWGDAWNAAWRATRDAAWGAAWDAAWYAAWAAARDAARDVAWDVAWDANTARLLQYLNGEVS